MHGGSPKDPGQFATEYELIKEFGWSWADLHQAPAIFIEESVYRLQAERRAIKMKEDQANGNLRSGY